MESIRSLKKKFVAENKSNFLRSTVNDIDISSLLVFDSYKLEHNYIPDEDGYAPTCIDCGDYGWYGCDYVFIGYIDTNDRVLCIGCKNVDVDAIVSRICSAKSIIKCSKCNAIIKTHQPKTIKCIDKISTNLWANLKRSSEL
jgi:hypothetical protein